MILTVIFIQIWFLPAIVAFPDILEVYLPTVILGHILEIFFICDIFVNLRTSFISEQSGLEVSEPKKIFSHYFYGGYLVLDIVSAFPF